MERSRLIPQRPHAAVRDCNHTPPWQPSPNIGQLHDKRLKTLYESRGLRWLDLSRGLRLAYDLNLLVSLGGSDV
jgi:hypothetical protein